MHLESPWVDVVAGFLPHSNRAFGWVVATQIIDSVLDEKTVNLSRGFISKELIGKIVLPCSNRKWPFVGIVGTSYQTPRFQSFPNQQVE